MRDSFFAIFFEDKGQKILKAIYDVLNYPKKERKITIHTLLILQIYTTFGAVQMMLK